MMNNITSDGSIYTATNFAELPGGKKKSLNLTKDLDPIISLQETQKNTSQDTTGM